MRPRHFGTPLGRIAACALLAVAPAGCLQRAARDEPPLVGEVHVEGAVQVPEDDITGKIALTSTWRDLGFWASARYVYEPDSLQADIKRIERYYATRGFFEARVKDTRVVEDDGRVNVTFVVVEGRQSPARRLRVTGLEPLAPADREEVLRGLPLVEGRPFDEELYDDTKAALRERLRGLGYAEVEVEGRVRVDRAAAAVDVQVTVAPGPRYKVARVFAYGAQNVSASRVIETSGIEEGQTYSPALLADAQARVYGLGIFSLVQVDPGPFDRRVGRVPIIITVNEAPFITREVGGGVDIDPTRWVFRTRALQTHRNLARGLQKLTVAGGVGYAFLPGLPSLFTGEIKKQGLVGEARVEYSQPKIGRSPFDVFGTIEYGKDVTQAFSYQRLAARLGAPWRPDWFRRLSVVPSVNFERYFAVENEGADLTTAGSVATTGCGSAVVTGDVFGACNILYGELRMNLDLRDDQISARRGTFFSLSAQYAGTPVSTFSYVRVTPEVRGYWTPWRYVTLAGRLRYGALSQVGSPSEAAPPGVAHFFAGGATSVRTAAAQQLGPREFTVSRSGDLPCHALDQSGCESSAPRPLGGSRLFEASLEARWRTTNEKLAFGTFFDVGGILGAPATVRGRKELPDQAWLPDHYQYGPGIGVRYDTPFGPFRFDVAYRLDFDPDTPASVAVPDPPAGTKPLGNDPQDYAFRRACDGAGGPAYACYEDTFNWRFLRGIQFFLTLGEAF